MPSYSIGTTSTLAFLRFSREPVGRRAPPFRTPEIPGRSQLAREFTVKVTLELRPPSLVFIISELIHPVSATHVGRTWCFARFWRRMELWQWSAHCVRLVPTAARMQQSIRKLLPYSGSDRRTGGGASTPAQKSRPPSTKGQGGRTVAETSRTAEGYIRVNGGHQSRSGPRNPSLPRPETPRATGCHIGYVIWSSRFLAESCRRT